VTVVVVALAVIAASSVFLFLYGINLLYLSARCVLLRPRPRLAEVPADQTVAVQLPIYNERYVAERVIDAACRMDWPRDRLEVQVLDDSNDDTPEIVARCVERWRRAGIAITHVRRASRAGYKAGALGHGLTLTDAELVAVFDADFVPAPDFLRRMVPALADPRVGFAQARWGHLNEEFSLLTYLQSLMTDFHFLVEQAVRPACGFLTNFAGSAGVWRRTAIDDAGGWSGDTLTEDLDLSYRAQLRGWRAVYLEDVVVPQELPVSANAYRAQQARWSTGSFQTASALLPGLLASRLSPMAKFEATMHLLGYVAPIAMVIQISCYPALLVLSASGQRSPVFILPVIGSVLSLAPAIGMAVGQWRRGREWWRHWYGLLGWSVLGAGTSLTIMFSIWRWLRGGGEFTRTPKYRIEHAGEEWRSKAYFKPRDAGAIAELAFGLAGTVLVVMTLEFRQPLLALYAGLFTVGYFYLAGASLVQSLRQVRYESVALRARALLPRLQAPALLAALTLVLLWVASVLPDPFEDSYQHWLIAANLATTGRLYDPLFQMQDTWLPAYHVMAALVLRVFGIWSIGALKSVDVLLGVGTLVITFRLARSRLQGLVAVTLLALNPIFILTTTQAVAEPLLVFFLLAAVWAANRGRLGLAALFGCLACLTGTKAWLWLGCVVAVVAVEWLVRSRARSSGGARRMLWVAPALALAVTMQVVFGFASHSVARAAVEVSSATARGSLPTDPLVRGGSFLGYFALASLPIVALAPFGFLRSLRGRPLTLLALPSLLYLLLVTGLVIAGVYSGSHRYYYPALPGLALAAAAAVDRVRLPLALLPAGAAAVVAVAFIPVLNGLAADNRGLVAAGTSASALPGALLTDSPAAAYWSHKPPSQIYGSEALPPDRPDAVAWMRSHSVGGLVLENIDYYRAHAVLPDLMGGEPSPPFLPVGASQQYIVPGGKDVHVYDLGRPVLVTPDGVGITTDQGAWPSRTKTAPLAKGPVLMAHGQDAAGGGMGFGLPIARFLDGWWFPGAGSPLQLTPESDGWIRTYDLDMHETDDASGHFVSFDPGPSHGQVQVTYRLSGDGGLAVQVRVLRMSAGLQQVVVLNEESSAFDDYADPSATRLGSAIGSRTAVRGDYARFRSGALGVEWAVPRPPSSAGFYAEREARGGAIDFSGLEWEFGPDLSSVDYTISIRRAR
jgi:cellulose synthase/poly-beta-1,6-N-acetylglucosamine synthase-like glycosyltransferase